MDRPLGGINTIFLKDNNVRLRVGLTKMFGCAGSHLHVVGRTLLCCWATIRPKQPCKSLITLRGGVGDQVEDGNGR